MYQVDLNCDLGESFGAYRIGMDEQIIPLISSANIACGFHASDPVVMEKTVKWQRKQGLEWERIQATRICRALAGGR